MRAWALLGFDPIDKIEKFRTHLAGMITNKDKIIHLHK
jgi:hypothetical protein